VDPNDLNDLVKGSNFSNFSFGVTTRCFERQFLRLKLLNALEDRQEANIYHYNSLLNSFSKAQL